MSAAEDIANVLAVAAAADRRHDWRRPVTSPKRGRAVRPAATVTPLPSEHGVVWCVSVRGRTGDWSLEWHGETRAKGIEIAKLAIFDLGIRGTVRVKRGKR